MAKKITSAIVCVCDNNSTRYFSLDEEFVRKLKDVLHSERYDIIEKYGKKVHCHSDDEADFSLVVDSFGSFDETPGSDDEKELFREIDSWLELRHLMGSQNEKPC